MSTDRPSRTAGLPVITGDRDRARGSWALIALVFLASAFLAHFALSRLGVPGLALVVAGVIGLVLMTWVSLRDLSVVLLLWLFSMGGLRWVGLVSMPGLPDFSFDRLLLVWIILMFLLRAIIERRRLEGPYIADALLFCHTVYVLVQLLVVGSIHFHVWVLSNLAPFFGFLYGKYICTEERTVRNLIAFFAALTVYYYVTSIAEQLRWDWLIWPKEILDLDWGFAPQGRSRGPLLHPPAFGQTLGMFALVYFFLLARPGRLVWKGFLGLSFVATLIGLLFTYTRGPWLATTVSMGVLGALRPNFRRLLGGFAVVAVLAGAVGVLQKGQSEFLQERMENTDTIENRLAFLASATRMIQDHPLFGIGFFRYVEERDKYNETSYIPFYGVVRRHYGEGMVPHDIYLGRMCEEGGVSLGLMLAFYGVVAAAFWRQWRGNPQGAWFNRDTLALFAAMMVNYLIGGMIIDYRYFDLLNVIFFLLAGILCGYRPPVAAPRT